MLDLFNLKQNNTSNKTVSTEKYKKSSKHFPSALREWKNSIYVYNKNSLNLIPSTTRWVNNIIKSYFSLYNKRLEAKMRTKRLLLRLRRKSSNKLYITNGGFKHTNNKVLINLYLFNRQKNNYILTLKKWYLETFLTNTTVKQRNININLIKRLKLINKKGIQAVKTANNNKYLLIKALNTISNKKNYNLNTFKNFNLYTENFYKNLIKKSLKKIRLYFFYKQLLHINNSKLNYTYLQYLKKHLEKIYNKNVEFNLINISLFYLNSDILSESITVKLARNRRRMFRYLNSLKNKIKISPKSKRKLILDKLGFRKQNQKNFSNNGLLLNNYILSNLKYKHITGFRLEARGRLSKRYTASRSVFRLKYDGSLLNKESSYKGLSSVLLKGNKRSNLQFTKLNSKTRIGSFGIKGWVSGS